MPIQLSGYSSVELIPADESARSWRSPNPKTQDKAVRSLASSYEKAYREEPRAASLIKAQWAWALLPSRSHDCQPPRQVIAQLAAAELVGVYFGLYYNPAKDSVHKRLCRTLGDILREAPATDGSLLAVQLEELLELQQPGGNLGQRAAIWGTKRDASDLFEFLNRAQCGSASQVQAMTRRCAQTALEGLLGCARGHLHDASWVALRNWPINALTLVENDAVLKTHEQLETLALLAILGYGTQLLDRLPTAAFAARKLFQSGEQKLTLVQWLLRPRNSYAHGELPAEADSERAFKLQFVLKQSPEPLWYPKGAVSPWLQGLLTDPSAQLVLDMLRVVSPSHRDCYSGATPLHLMACVPTSDGSWSMLAALLTQGADPCACDNSGETALRALESSPYAHAVRVFPNWYKKIHATMETYCQATQTPPHVVAAVLLRHNDSLNEEAAARLLKACRDVMQQGKQDVSAYHNVFFVRGAVNWVRGQSASEQQERLATLERVPSVAVGERIFETTRELRGCEWRILRMLLAHMRKCKLQSTGPRIVGELMDDICLARNGRLDHIVMAVSDFRALSLEWFGGDIVKGYPVAYWALLGMHQLNAKHPSQRVSAAVARQLKKIHQNTRVHELFAWQITGQEIDQLFSGICAALKDEMGEASKHAGLLSRMVDKVDKFLGGVDCAPLFDDDWTAESIVDKVTPDDLQAPDAPPEHKAGGTTSEALPAAGAAAPSFSAGAVDSAQEPPLVDEAALPVNDNPLWPIVAQGIEPLLRDLRAGRLAESELQPLRALAEAVDKQAALLRGPAPLFDCALQTLRAAHDGPAGPATQIAGEVREHVALVSQVLHNELLQSVMLGTTGIGETERMQRVTKRLVSRSFVQVLACALGDAFTLVYFSSDAQARGTALRKLLFRVAPDKCVWAQSHAETMQAIKELFQFVSGFKALREQQPQLENFVISMQRRSTGR